MIDNHSPILIELLSRTALQSPFDQFLASVSNSYPSIGTIRSITPIKEGYEAANFILETTTGKYVVKIFEKGRELKNISSLTHILHEAPHVGISVPKLITGKAGELTHFADPVSGQSVPYYITQFFPGTDFMHILPSLEDMQKVATYVAALNCLNFPVSSVYDSWGNTNLVREVEQAKNTVDSQVVLTVEPIVNLLRTIDYSSLPQAVIHGDYQRKHILKDANSNYCMIDFGCMRNAARIIDLSIYLAWFCLPQEYWEKASSIIPLVLNIYEQRHPLTEAEHRALPVLIQATYAAYYFKTSQLISAGDTSTQTRDWHTESRTLLSLSRNFFI